MGSRLSGRLAVRTRVSLAASANEQQAFSGVSAPHQVKLDPQAVVEKTRDPMTKHARNLTKTVEIDNVFALGARSIAHLKQLNRFRAMSGCKSGQLVCLARFHDVLVGCRAHFFQFSLGVMPLTSLKETTPTICSSWSRIGKARKL